MDRIKRVKFTEGRKEKIKNYLKYSLGGLFFGATVLNVVSKDYINVLSWGAFSLFFYEDAICRKERVLKVTKYMLLGMLLTNTVVSLWNKNMSAAIGWIIAASVYIDLIRNKNK